MNGAPGNDTAATPTSSSRRRELDAVFGDVLPETTTDERDLAEAGDDSWYTANRPPHHEPR